MEIQPYQEKTTEYMFCQGQGKTAFTEAIKTKGTLKDYLKKKKIANVRVRKPEN